MSDSEVGSRVQRLLLLICLGLFPATVITNYTPCQNGQVNAYGVCSPIILNIYSNLCGGQTGIQCNPSNPVTTVVPGTPGCPNTPQYPTVVPNNPSNPVTTVVPGTPGCPNTPQYPTVVPNNPSNPNVNVVPGTPGCPNTPQYPTVVPDKPLCPNTPTTPACPNANGPSSCNSNGTSSYPNASSPTSPRTTTLPSVTEQPAPAPQANPTPPPQSSPVPVPVITPPPDPIIRCPEGTILVKGACRLLFCGGNSLYIEGRCIQARCPAGYVWTGIRCSKPQPLELGNIQIENTVHQLPGTLPHLISNNVNHVMVNASITIPEQASEEEEEQVEVVAPPQPPSSPCCNVFAPRVCATQAGQDGYKCFSRSQQQCGSVCSARKMMLAPVAVTSWTQSNSQMVAMPPNWAAQACQSNNGICQQPQNFYDCSGCAMGHLSTCSSYCYSYKCSTHNCAYYDQAQYCSQYAGQIGCQAEDGWIQTA
ncbi:cell wall adhesin EAP1 isoform X2 [Drosophila sechellia]|uniref:cell wall adhesin EAP1 isoform X2 n=1 Tax=Drosophila sechellia TaxID=7238 RepID=UPI0013DE0A4F|nr:cell wall adhesin EAP1 isoform X2 [Drosophila sechellia]